MRIQARGLNLALAKDRVGLVIENQNSWNVEEDIHESIYLKSFVLSVDNLVLIKMNVNKRLK